MDAVQSGTAQMSCVHHIIGQENQTLLHFVACMPFGLNVQEPEMHGVIMVVE